MCTETLSVACWGELEEQVRKNKYEINRVGTQHPAKGTLRLVHWHPFWDVVRLTR